MTLVSILQLKAFLKQWLANKLVNQIVVAHVTFHTGMMAMQLQWTAVCVSILILQKVIFTQRVFFAISKPARGVPTQDSTIAVMN